MIRPRTFIFYLLVLPSVLTQPAHALTVDDPVPGRAGRDNQLRVTGATPGAKVRVAMGFPGTQVVPECPGLALEIEPRWVSPPVVASAQGEATFGRFVPGRLEGATTGVHAFEVASCALSPALWTTWPKAFEVGLERADARMIGAFGSWAGYDVAGAGDVDADGFDDVLVAAAFASGREPGSGVAYLLSGPITGNVDLTVGSMARMGGEYHLDRVSRVAGAGDVNGDGFDDVLVGAREYPQYTSGEGAAYLVLGPVAGDLHLADADARLVGSHAEEHAGEEVAAAGDVDDDGFADVLIGAPFNNANGDYAGVVYLLRGPFLGNIDPADADARLFGEESLSPGTWAGFYLSAAGDQNGDGFGDILIGAPSFRRLDGISYLVHGPISGAIDLSTADARLHGVPRIQSRASCVEGTGDVNGDGRNDILIGAFDTGLGAQSAGGVYLLQRSVAGEVDLTSEAEAVLVGDMWGGDAGGTSVASADVNGDGFDDIEVGTFMKDVSYLVMGPVRGVMDLANADLRFEAEAPGDMAGTVANAGDVDADGLADILIGAHRYNVPDGSRYEGGAAYLFLGSSL